MFSLMICGIFAIYAIALLGYFLTRTAGFTFRAAKHLPNDVQSFRERHQRNKNYLKSDLNPNRGKSSYRIGKELRAELRSNAKYWREVERNKKSQRIS